MATSLINDIVEMGDDSLWVIPNGNGLHCLVHGILKNVQMADHFYPVINQLVHGSDGFYYALGDAGLFRLGEEPFCQDLLAGQRQEGSRV